MSLNIGQQPNSQRGGEGGGHWGGKEKMNGLIVEQISKSFVYRLRPIWQPNPMDKEMKE